MLRCLAKHPENRPADFETLSGELARIYESVIGQPFPLKKPTQVELDQRQKDDRAQALTRLGLRGIIPHRDIKPENIITTPITQYFQFIREICRDMEGR